MIMFQMGLDYNKCITTDTFSVSIVSYNRNWGASDSWMGWVSLYGRLDTIWYLFGYWEMMKNNIHAKEDFLHLAKEEMMAGDKGSGDL